MKKKRKLGNVCQKMETPKQRRNEQNARPKPKAGNCSLTRGNVEIEPVSDSTSPN